MSSRGFGQPSFDYSNETKWRFRFSLLTVISTVALLAWGAFVTSIGAGMAVPDWPQSFGTMDQFRTGLYDPDDPSVRWWNYTPVLAEHGHRLIGALVGLLTLALAVWTWLADPRRWMRWLGVGALVLVTAQGILGGLRVTENSIAMATIHACTAQIFFAMLVGMTLFTSRSWIEGRSLLPDTARTSTFQTLTLVSVVFLYAQIVLGALLRHLGHGIDVAFAVIHITGAFVVTGLIFATFVYVQKYFDANRTLKRWSWALLGGVGVQFALGLAAYLVLIHEVATAVQTNLQIVLTVSHLVVGAFLLAAAVGVTLLAWRAPEQTEVPASGDGVPSESVSPTRQPISAD